MLVCFIFINAGSINPLSAKQQTAKFTFANFIKNVSVSVISDPEFKY